jgi:hypothetical protein
MKSFAAKVEEGVKGIDGKPSVGPVYRNLLSEKGFPPIDSEITTAWDIFSKSVEKFPDNNMLGWRRIVDEKVSFLNFSYCYLTKRRENIYGLIRIFVRIGLGWTIYVENVQGSIRRSFADWLCTTSRRS